MNEEAARIAEEAARIISERGHWKGDYHGPDGSSCLFGALYAAMGLRREHYGWKAYTPMADAVCVPLYARVGEFDLVKWNDLDETTGEDVILALKQTAEELRS